MVDLPLPEPNPRWAWFFDVDGTLIDIAETPQSVVVPPDVVPTLNALQRYAAGAVALISGRDVATLDRLFAPLRLACAGVHGLERRDAEGRFSTDAPSPALAPLRAELERFRAVHAGLSIEAKGTETCLALALHYRAAPEAEPQAQAFARDVASRYGDALKIQPGKKVIEFRTPSGGKDIAIARFLTQPFFAGRTPVFAGDDAGDEAAFTAVNARGGITLHIGEGGATAARWRVAGPAALIAWLAAKAIVPVSAP